MMDDDRALLEHQIAALEMLVETCRTDVLRSRSGSADAALVRAEAALGMLRGRVTLH